MFGIGIQEFGLILVVALLVFGPKRLPELARMLGRGMAEFRRASNDLRQSLSLDDIQNDLRRDLHSAKSLLKPDLKAAAKPEADDRPAQAGDELNSTPAPESGVRPTTQTAAETKTEIDPHQGELPLDNDHEHHPGSEPDTEPDAGMESVPNTGTDSRATTLTDGPAGEARLRGPADPERG